MEVHHHPDLHHNPKKWKEYILEFIMIFLAVTMGFIAENIREHQTEHRNAHILAESLLEDMKQDTSSLNTLIAFSNFKTSSVDSALKILHSPRESWNDSVFYQKIAPTATSFHFMSTDGTYMQLKSTGSMRFFKQSLANKINAYNVQLKKTEYRDGVGDKGTWLLADLYFNIINAEVLSDIRFKKPITHEMYIHIENNAQLDKLINLVSINSTFQKRCLQEYQIQLKLANDLIDELKNEYQLE